MENISANYKKVCYNVWECYSMIYLVETEIKSLKEKNKYKSKVIKSNNSFKYKEDDFLVVLKIVNNNIYLTRQNDKIYQKFIFKNSDKSLLTYLLKENNYQFKIEFITKKIIILKNKITILYKIDDDCFEYNLQFKEVI